MHRGEMPPLIRLTDKVWMLGSDWTFLGVSVPRGFRTDGASGPIDAWSGHGGPAYIGHDWLYVCLDVGIPDPVAPTRQAADRWFLQALKVLKVRPLVRLTMFLAVRILGSKLTKHFWIKG